MTNNNGNPTGSTKPKAYKPRMAESPEEWQERAVSIALGFRVRRIALMSYQVQFLDTYGRVDRVRPASREEVIMFRTLCMPPGQWPLPADNGSGNGNGGA